MSRLNQYLTYHITSADIGDIDPSYNMLLYVCDRFELNVEQRFWLAFVYAMTYCGASVYYVYNEFPDYENLNSGRLNRWWYERGRSEIICQTDRRWVRSSSLFVPAVESYRGWIGKGTQQEHFERLAVGDTPEKRYDKVYLSAMNLYSFGQFSLFLYLEALHTITPLNLVPTDLDLDLAWSCRNGLYYAYDMDQWINDTESRTDPAIKAETDVRWRSLRATLARLPTPPTVWNTETMLCAYRKFHRGKRYIGYYLDRQAAEIAKMEDHVRHGVAWDVLWQFREETLDHDFLPELHNGVSQAGITGRWKQKGEQFTRAILDAVEA